MDPTLREDAARLRRRLVDGHVPPDVVRSALTSIPTNDRDAWFDLVLGLGDLPDDGPDLPRGCVPYLPCSVDALLPLVQRAGVRADDVFVDIGAGLGRAAIFVHLLSGAAAIGLEIQSALARSARDLVHGLDLPGVSILHADAADLLSHAPHGTVYFLYCPFSGARLERVLDDLESIARTRAIRLGCVGLPLLRRPWLRPIPIPAPDLALYHSA